ncbi:MAG: leucine-rich repeat protein [Ruminococcus sp.]
MKNFKRAISIIICVVMLTGTVLSINAQGITPIDFSQGSSGALLDLGAKEELAPSGGKVTVDGITISTYDSTNAYIEYAFIDEEGTANVPCEVGGYTITGISGKVYFGQKVTDIVVGETLDYFADYCFHFNGAVNSITFLGNTKSVYMALREDVYLVKNINIADSNPYLTSVDGVAYTKDMTKLEAYPTGRNPVEVTVDSRVKRIETNIFNGCVSIEKFNFSANLEYIEPSAMYYLKNLKEITVDKSNKNYSVINSALIYTDEYNYSQIVLCPRQSGIKNFSVPSSFDKNLYKVCDYAFDSISTLESVVLPKTVNLLGKYAFSGCNNMKKFSAAGAASIGNYCFCYCTNLSDLTLSDKYTSLGNGAFSNCESITEFKIPTSCSNIGTDCFNGVVMKNLSVPCSMTIIRPNTFAGLKVTDELHIEEGVAIIADNAFMGCEPKKIFLPSTLEAVPSNNIVSTDLNYTRSATVYGEKGSYAHIFALYASFGFRDEKNNFSCDGYRSYASLKKTVVDGKITITGYNGDFSEYSVPAKIYGFAVTAIADKAFKDSKAGKITLSSTLKSIGNYAFQNAKVLSGITIPNTVETIGDYAFENCTGLETLKIGSAVKKIGKYAFYNCRGIVSAVVPDSVTEMGESAFSKCVSLQKITVSNSLSEIPNYCFKECSNLKDVTIGSSVTTLNGFSFSYCKSLVNIKIPSSVTKFYYGVFYGCSSLESYNVDSENAVFSDIDGVLLNKDKTELIRYPYAKESDCYYVPSTVSKASDNAFDNTTRLKKVVLSNSMTSVSPYLFFKSTSLETVQMPESITSVEDNAFNSCTSLKNVFFSVNMQEIKKQAFYGCTALQSITIPDLVTEIGESAFKNCKALENINLNNVKVIGLRAFYGTAVKKVIMPLTVTEVRSYAFANCDNLSKVVFYKTNPTLGKKCIGYTNVSTTSTESYLKQTTDITIYGYTDTTPETYAKDNTITFSEPSPEDFVTEPTVPQETLPLTPPTTVPVTTVPTTQPVTTVPASPSIKVPKISLTKFSTNAGTVRTLKVTNGAVKSWSTSNKKIATVKSGKVTSLNKGTAQITATLTTGKKLTCRVTVNSSPKLSKTTVSVKKGKTVKVTLTGKASAINNKYTNTKYAKITSKTSAKTITIKGLKKGTTTLKVKVNGVKTLSLRVKVK